eukprot:1373308-Amorphochlora_amoeboformis.AAC.1
MGREGGSKRREREIGRVRKRELEGERGRQRKREREREKEVLSEKNTQECFEQSTESTVKTAYLIHELVNILACRQKVSIFTSSGNICTCNDGRHREILTSSR